MADERSRIPRSELGRWLLVALLLVTGVVLYFLDAPRAERMVRPVTQDSTP